MVPLYRSLHETGYKKRTALNEISRPIFCGEHLKLRKYTVILTQVDMFSQTLTEYGRVYSLMPILFVHDYPIGAVNFNYHQ